MRDFLKGAGYAVLAIFFLLPVATVVVAFVWTWLTNPFYAARVFDGLVPYDRVLASRGGSFTLDWDCTYALVALADDAPISPPTRTADREGWRYAFGGNWRRTSAVPLGEDTRDAVRECGAAFPGEVAAELRRALAEPGSWYVSEDPGETVFVYSVPRRIAALIRYGD